jgi:predicted ATPase
LAELILRACPRVRILATSRERLGTPGEFLWRVPSLALPTANGAASIEELNGCESVRLFVERAGAACPGFSLTERTAVGVRQLCQRLDGIPSRFDSMTGFGSW